MKLVAAVRVAIPDPEHAEDNTILPGLKLVAELRDTSCSIISDAKKLSSLDL